LKRIQRESRAQGKGRALEQDTINSFLGYLSHRATGDEILYKKYRFVT
jgi:hypothetical protein